jgi:hypothetical protein
MNLEELKIKFEFREPNWSLDNEDNDVIWRFGKIPDYTLANTAFLLGKTQDHKVGNKNV